jgi:hypothetical protein
MSEHYIMPQSPRPVVGSEQREFAIRKFEESPEASERCDVSVIELSGRPACVCGVCSHGGETLWVRWRNMAAGSIAGRGGSG